MIGFLKRYVSFFEGTYGQAALGTALAFATGLTLVPVPLLIGHAFDRAIPEGRVDLLLQIGAALLGLQVVNSLSILVTRHVILRVTKQVTALIRRRAVERLLEAPRSYYTQRDLATLHDLVVPETERVDVMSNALLGQIMPAAVLGAGICVVLLTLNWMLFAAMLAVLPLNVLTGRRIGRHMRHHIGRFHQSYERFSQGVLFLVRAIDLTRIQNAEAHETVRQGQRIDDLKETSGDMSWVSTFYSVTQQSLVTVSGVVVLVAGGALVAAEMMTLGSLLSFFAGLMLLRNPLHNVLTGMPRVIEGAQSLRHVLTFLDGDEREPYGGSRVLEFTGAVSLRDVSFAYGDAPVLSSVTLDLTPGEIVAVVGRNGSGKSTMVNLILGFYRPAQGALLADGVPYDELDMPRLRRAIAVVTQDALLVPGTIRENLTYGLPDVTPESLVGAARVTGVDAIAARCPDGFDTPIGDDGKLLSGGQRQRLSLARALVSRPRLLILDEPMNHLDEKDNAEFLRRLTAAAGHPAVLLISHREDVSVADRVYRLESGRLSPITAADAVHGPGATPVTGLAR